MISRIISILVFVCSTTVLINGQQTFSHTYDMDPQGDIDDWLERDEFNQFLIIQDTLYIYARMKVDSLFSTRICKLDSDGNVIKTRIIKNFYPAWKHTMIQDGDKLVLAQSSGYYNEAHYSLLVLNTNLDSLDRRDYYLNRDSLIFVEDRSLVQFDNYYIITGFSEFEGGGGAESPSLMLWIDRSTLEIDTIISISLSHWHEQAAFNQTSFHYSAVGPDGSLIVGYKRHWDTSGTGKGFLRFNTEKEIVWEWEAQREPNRLGEDALLLKNGNIVFEQTIDTLGQRAGDYTLVCINPDGVRLWAWDEPHYGTTLAGPKNVLYLSECQNGDILITGELDWRWDFDGSIPPPHGGNEGNYYDAGYIARVSGEGKLLWERAVMSLDQYGNVEGFYLLDGHELSDGSLVFSGTAEVYSDTVLFGLPDSYDSWLVRTDSTGCLSAFCDFQTLESFPLATFDLNIARTDKIFKVLQNPVSGPLRISINETYIHERKIISVFDLNGKVISQFSFEKQDELLIDQFSNLPAGMYNISVMLPDQGLIQFEKIIKV